MKAVGFLLAAIVFVLLVALVAQSGDQMKCVTANSNGEIVLSQQAHVGSDMLPPGKYLLHSSDANGKHYVHFVEESKQFEVHPEASEQTYSTHVAEVTCMKETANKPSATAVFYTEADGGMRIIKAQIKGEDHVHVF